MSAFLPDIEGEAERELEKRMVDDGTIEDETFFKRIRQKYKAFADTPEGTLLDIASAIHTKNYIVFLPTSLLILSLMERR